MVGKKRGRWWKGKVEEKGADGLDRAQRVAREGWGLDMVQYGPVLAGLGPPEGDIGMGGEEGDISP